MKDIKVRVYMILKGINSIERVPIHTFISNNREMAIIYLEDFLSKSNDYGYYSLHEILTFEKNQIKNNDIFITAKWHTANSKYPRETIKECQKTIEMARKEKEMKNAIKILFRAREIKTNDKEEVSTINQ